MLSAERNLQNLNSVLPLYLLPSDPLAEEVLIPGFSISENVDCMVGFFSSEVLGSLAPGLATYINESQNNLRLVFSPLLRSEDLAAIEDGTKSVEEVAGQVVDEQIITENQLQQHTLKCLSWLIREGRIEIKIALMKDALFHPKVWLFQVGEEVLAVHGSSNMTQAGIKRNIEQVSVSKSWEDPNQRYIAEKLLFQFKQLWDNKVEDCFVVSAPYAVRERILRIYNSDTPPTETELRRLYDQASKTVGETSGVFKSVKSSFGIPKELKYEVGPFAHQGEAVRAWCDAGYNGVLEMATGSGKTITAMLCAYNLFQAQKPILIVVAAPYVPLIEQWCEEILPFGIAPVNLTVAGSAAKRSAELQKLNRRIRNGTTEVEAIVISHDTLCTPEFHRALDRFDCLRLLIADEVHNLGRHSFVNDPPAFFEHRLGLSATPVRQYDEEGTNALFEFFGPTVFEFPLEKAIGRCLVEYDYFVHPVELTRNEMDAWYELTTKIKANTWRLEEMAQDDYINKLLRDRRALLETAENKLSALETVLKSEDLRNLRHTLIYVSDKAPKQLESVNNMLNSFGILFRQITYLETANRNDTARILKSFQAGTIRILTAKRVLDEGVNIPQVQKAFILASTTVERQWVQRRGRLLRKCSEINKTHSEIHDFIALPPSTDVSDPEARNLVRSELLRVQAFARLARNAGRPTGPLPTIDKLVKIAYM